MKRPRLLFAFALSALLCAPPLLLPEQHQAAASVSIALSMEKLAGVADSVALADPQESFSRWEDGRIVTLTRMRLAERVAGEAPREFWVRSLGGTVGDIGQLVEGEPTFSKGERVLLFLRTTPSLERTVPVNLVVGRSQGMYFLHTKDGVTRLRPHHNLGHLLPAKLVGPLSLESAAVMPAWRYLQQRPLRETLSEVRQAWLRQHPPASNSQ